MYGRRKKHIFAFVIYVCGPTDELIVLWETGLSTGNNDLRTVGKIKQFADHLHKLIAQWTYFKEENAKKVHRLAQDVPKGLEADHATPLGKSINHADPKQQEWWCNGRVVQREEGRLPWWQEEEDSRVTGPEQAHNREQKQVTGSSCGQKQYKCTRREGMPFIAQNKGVNGKKQH